MLNKLLTHSTAQGLALLHTHASETYERALVRMHILFPYMQQHVPYAGRCCPAYVRVWWLVLYVIKRTNVLCSVWTNEITRAAYGIRVKYLARCCLSPATKVGYSPNTRALLCHLPRGSLPWPTDDFTALHFRKGKCTHAFAERMPEADGREGGRVAHV